MRSIAIINQKGGVGKTTSTLNLGATLAAMGKRVLLMDLDSQANLTTWVLGPAGEELEITAAELFLGGCSFEDLIVPTPFENLDIIPADLRLSGVERSLASELHPEILLKKAIEASQIDPGLGDPSFDLYDYLLIDCPPSIGVVTVNALTACKEVLIPVQAQVLALNGVKNLCKVIETIQHRLNPELKISGVLICMADSRTNLSREVEELARRHFGPLVFTSVIRDNIRVAECPSYFRPLYQYAPSCPATLDYRNLAIEIIKQEENIIGDAAIDIPAAIAPLPAIESHSVDSRISLIDALEQQPASVTESLG